jgi:glutamate 5-kinase
MSLRAGGLVAKFGSSSVADHDRGNIRQYRVDGYAEQLTRLNKKYNVVVVTSGAVAVGHRRLETLYSHADVAAEPVLASLGSAAINEAWYRAFRRQGQAAGQALVTHRDMERPRPRKTHLLDAIHSCFMAEVIPVFNENDLLSQEELRKLAYGGDNDGLASHLATSLGDYFGTRQRLLLLTDVDGFLKNGQVQRQLPVGDVDSEVEALQAELENLDLAWPQRKGKGNIVSKLVAAQAAILNSEGRDAAFIGHAGADYAQMIAGTVGTQVVQ